MIGYKYITYCSTRNMSLYQVRIPEIIDGELVRASTKYTSYCFSFSHYKTQKSCLIAAVRMRNKRLKEMNATHLIGKIHRSNHVEVIKHSPRNTSGVIGVTLDFTHKEYGAYYSYRAIWREKINGVPYNKKSFSPNVYGECEAFKKACRARYDKKKPLVVTNLDAIPCLPDVPYQLETTGE